VSLNLTLKNYHGVLFLLNNFMKNFFKTLLLSLALTMSVFAHSKEILKVYLLVPPGGVNDIMLRKMQALTPENSKYQIVIEFRPGGDGVVAMNALNNDNSPHAIMFLAPALVNKASENEKTLQEVKNLVPVANLYEFGSTFVTANDSRYKTWNDVMEEARSGRPMNIASTAGALTRVIEKHFEKYPNVTVVPYIGDRNTLTGVLNGSVQVAQLTAGGSVTPVTQNQVRGLLLTYGPSLYNIPSASANKIAFPYLPIAGGFVARKDTPKELVAEYNKFLFDLTMHPEMLELYKQSMMNLPQDTSANAFKNVINRLINEAPAKK
jgi:tripartite-type tricarboxylate transporter receptor subunit TctC